MSKQWIDPKKLKEDDLPLIVLSDDRRSFIGWAIKAHSSGNYNHIMELYRPETLASQDFRGFRELSIDKYMKSFMFLKFWRVKIMTKEQQEAWISSVKEDLLAPWRERRYDFLGLLGQLLPGKWTRSLNNPRTRYCSERVAVRLRKIFNSNIPKHPNPSELDELFKTMPEMECLGYWVKS